MGSETSLAPRNHSLSVCGMLDEPLRGLLLPAEPAIEKIFAVDRLVELYRNSGGIAKMLEHLGIRIEVTPEDLAQIPRTGPLVMVSNHPFGLLDAIVLTIVLPQVRPDLRILANSMLASFREPREYCIFVDNFGRRDAVSGNSNALRDCIRLLRKGGALLAFPAGEVSRMNFKDGSVADGPWNPTAARLAQMAGAPAVPIFFRGGNSAAFHFAGAIHPMLRTAILPRELLNKRGQTIEVRIGRPVSADTLRRFDDAADATEYLRCRTYLLESEAEPRADTERLRKPPAPLAAAAPQAEIAGQIARLPPQRLLCESGGLAVFVARQEEFPAVVREIGRLREIAFRRVGEGTGRDADLDRFDRYYDHLALWDRETARIVGAYRLAPAPDVLASHGLNGLYTSTLFRYSKKLLERIGPAVELGRSFIRPEYQKQYAPLLLLWKAIACYAARRPECATLFGAVSVSNEYHPVSRHLIVKFLEAHRAEGLARMVTPRSAYHPDERLLRRGGVPRRVPEGLDDLGTLIAELERDGKGVPILIKQYLKTGGRVLGFNVDRHFSNALDALIMVDLRTAPVPLLDRYMGKTRAAEFRAWHAARGAEGIGGAPAEDSEKPPSVAWG
jgi:putative hemolysin